MQINDITASVEANKFKNDYKNQKAETDKFETRLKEAAEKKDLNALREVANDFEEVFVNLLLKEMRKTVGDGGLIEKSYQQEAFEGMLDENYAETVADVGGLGLSDMIYEQLKQYTVEDTAATFDVKK